MKLFYVSERSTLINTPFHWSNKLKFQFKNLLFSYLHQLPTNVFPLQAEAERILKEQVTHMYPTYTNTQYHCATEFKLDVWPSSQFLLYSDDGV